MGRRIYRDGKAVEGHTDEQARKARRRAKGKLNREEKRANTRAKYGPSGKPAPVTVRKINETTGEAEIVDVVDQWQLGAIPKPRTERRRRRRARRRAARESE